MPKRRIYVNQQDYHGMAADGSRNYELWNVAHVAAFHDDLKLLSLATHEQCRTPNKWGITPAHMCAMSSHPYGASLCVLYELVQMGAADPEALTSSGQTPWHVAQRNQRVENLKKFEKVLLKSFKPEFYEERKAGQLRARGKFAKALSIPAGIVADVVEVGERRPPTIPTCLVFPGQGSQYVGMMKDLKDHPSVRPLVEKAKEILGYDVLDLCLKGPEEELSRTKNCQPAMFLAGMAAVEKLKSDHPDRVDCCQAVAGLSLGEYTALTVAGVFSFDDGLKLVKARAEAMEHETVKDGAPAQAMMSVAGLDEAKLEQCCREATLEGETCQIANFLFPKGFSVAGSKASVEALEVKVTAAGALQAKLLKTSGAFHTPIMQGAREKLLGALAEAEPRMRPPRCQVYMNVSARPIDPDTPTSEIISMMGDQLTKAVRWEESMQAAVRDGCREFFECGPSRQLMAMMKRIDADVARTMVNVAA